MGGGHEIPSFLKKQFTRHLTGAVIATTLTGTVYWIWNQRRIRSRKDYYDKVAALTQQQEKQ